MLKKKEQRREGQLECYTLPDDCRKNAKEKKNSDRLAARRTPKRQAGSSSYPKATGWQPVLPQ